LKMLFPGSKFATSTKPSTDTALTISLSQHTHIQRDTAVEFARHDEWKQGVEDTDACELPSLMKADHEPSDLMTKHAF
jgi:hypothetical protein